MRAAGIDLGTVRVGVAVADELGLMAHPRPHLDGRDVGRLVERLKELAQSEGLTHFVVGLPARLSGVEGPEARRARLFAKKLEQSTSLQVELLDERWSTKEAERRLREQGLSSKEQRSRIDSAAAALLLQSWLDRQKTE